MTVYRLDPLQDSRWEDFVSQHELGSVFHGRQWLETLRRTYDYYPVVYTTSSPSSPLSNGVVFCGIKSWLTGRRLVSLPFSDHCQPLLDGPDTYFAIVKELRKEVSSGRWNYTELRPMTGLPDTDGAVKTTTCHLHLLDLRPTAAELFKGFHKDCIQRKVRRAEREGLVYESGNSESLLQAFYRLMVETRRRQQLPPQPMKWFRNAVACLGDRLRIRVAWKDTQATAAILTLQHKGTIVYKYGCSDSETQNLGGTPFLFWKTIVEAKEQGATCMDLGRSDLDNPGLIAFKERLGATPSEMTYFRWVQKPSGGASQSRFVGAAKQIFSVMPNAALQVAGRILYRHVG